jgi:hypothetical protein
MSKGQHGNREAKKPKKDPAPKPTSVADVVPTAAGAAQDRQKKKRAP